MLTFFGLSYKTIKSLMRYDYAPVMAISIFTVLSWLISTFANIYCIFKVGGWTSYTIFNGDIASQVRNKSSPLISVSKIFINDYQIYSFFPGVHAEVLQR